MLRLAVVLLSLTLAAGAQIFGTSPARRVRSGTTLPATCTPNGELFFDTDAPAGSNIYGCTATNVWTVQAGGASLDPGLLTEITPPGAPPANQGYVYARDISGETYFCFESTTGEMCMGASGLQNSSTSPTLLTGVDQTSDPAAPGAGKWSLYAIAGIPKVRSGAAGSAYELGLISGSKTQNKQVTFDASGHLIASNYDVGAAGGGGSGAPNYSQSFTSQTSVALTHNLGTKNVLVACYNGSDNALEWNTLAIAGTAPYNVTVTFTSSQSGRCVVNGNGTAKYSAAFTSQTSISVTGATHLLGTCDVGVTVFDASSPTKRVEPDSVTCDGTSKDIVIAFSASQSGRYTIQ